MKRENEYHCISCPFFNKHIYDTIFLNHECTRTDDIEVEQLQFCPECAEELIYDENSGEDYCPQCGLVCTGPIRYVAGKQIIYPYGIKL